VSWLEVLVVIAIIGFVIYQQDGSTFLGGGFGGHDRDASGRY
jgi:hypothetical protein